MGKYYRRQDRAKAVEILVKDLKVFAAFNEELFKEITQLLTLDNFRYEYGYPWISCIFAWFINIFFLAYNVGIYDFAEIMNSYQSMEIQNLPEA